MLVLSSTLLNRPIMSLRVGRQIGLAKSVIINPHTLSILGWWCAQTGLPGRQVLLTSEIRENGAHGIVVDDMNSIADESELHRYQDILQLEFFLINKLVKSSSKKLGKITDYAVDETFMVQKLYVEQTLLRALASDTLLISRSQIIEVTDTYIMVADASLPAKNKSMAEKLGIVPQSA